jgi:hypothetical protein
LILTKNGLGYNLGDFFTNSSGLPGFGPKGTQCLLFDILELVGFLAQKMLTLL